MTSTSGASEARRLAEEAKRLLRKLPAGGLRDTLDRQGVPISAAIDRLAALAAPCDAPAPQVQSGQADDARDTARLDALADPLVQDRIDFGADGWAAQFADGEWRPVEDARAAIDAAMQALERDSPNQPKGDQS